MVKKYSIPFMTTDIQHLFHQAVRDNDVETARRMLADGADVNAPFQVYYDKNSSYTHYSIFDCLDDSRLEMLKLLIAAGADVNIRDKFEESPLSECCSDFAPECVKLLIEHGANVNSRDDEGSTPLVSAIIGREPEILRILIESGASVNVVSVNPRESVYEMAKNRAWYHDDEELHQCVNLLEEAGALDNLILDITDLPGLSRENHAFLLAVQYRDIFGVKKALAAGADVNCTGWYDISAVSQSAYYADKKLCQLLVEAGIKPEFIESACSECCWQNSDAETFEYLLQQLDKDALNRVYKKLYRKINHYKLLEIMDRYHA